MTPCLKGHSSIFVVCKVYKKKLSNIEKITYAVFTSDC